VSSPAVVAIVAFVASLALGAWLWRSGRAPAAFALLIGAPLVGALAFAGVAALSGRADAHAVAAEPASGPVASPPPAAAAPGAGSTEVDGWRHAAEQLRHARRFAEARDLLQKVVKAAPMDADAWADLGDASAAAAGDDLTAGRDAIDRALTLNPAHTKALWLKASLELQEHHYAAAAKLWQELLGHLPAGSSDAKIVEANLEEARALDARGGRP